MTKSRLGSGARFKALVSKLERHIPGATARGRASAKSRPGGGKIRNPAALAAAIGRKKYGKKKFQKLAVAGKRRK